MTYEYDAEGRLVSQVTWWYDFFSPNPQLVLSNKEEIEYGENSYTTTNFYYSSETESWVPSGRTVNLLTESGLCISSIQYRYDYETGELISDYKDEKALNENGLVASITYSRWENDTWNPETVVTAEYNDNNQRTVVTDATFNLAYNLFKCLKLSSTFGVKYNSGHEDTYSARTTLRGMNSGVPVGSSTRRDVSYMSWSNNNVATYKQKFGKHGVMLLAGLELSSQANKYSYISGSGFMNDHIKEIEYAENVSTYSYTNVKNSRDMSYFGRA